MEQFTGVLVLLASDRLAGGAVDVAELVVPSTGPARMHGRGRHREPITPFQRLPVVTKGLGGQVGSSMFWLSTRRVMSGTWG